MVFFLPSFFFLFFFTRRNVAAPLAARRERREPRGFSLRTWMKPISDSALSPRRLHVCRGSLRRQIIALWMGPRGIFGFGFERSIPCSCYFYLRQYGRQPVSSLLTVGCHWCLRGPERKACRARAVLQRCARHCVQSHSTCPINCVQQCSNCATISFFVVFTFTIYSICLQIWTKGFYCEKSR